MIIFQVEDLKKEADSLQKEKEDLQEENDRVENETTTVIPAVRLVRLIFLNF